MASNEEKLPVPAEESKVEASTSLSDNSPSPSTPSPVPSSTIVTSKSGQKRKLTASSSAAASSKKADIPADEHKSSSSPSFSLFEPLPPSSPLVSSFRDGLLSHFFPKSHAPTSAQTSLPGPQPASMIRSDLSKLEVGEYWVCEKSDGERAILLIHSATRKVVLVDRSWSCRVMRGECAEVLVELFASQGDSVIDAELLEIERGEEDGREHGEDRERVGPFYRVSMFDVLAINGVSVIDRPFGGMWNAANVSDDSGRMDVIIKQIQQPYKERIKRARNEWPLLQQQRGADDPPVSSLPAALLLDDHFDLFTKTFVAKHNVEQILKAITHSPNPSHPHFLSHVYRSSRGVNLNDGLIFTPDRESYHCRTIPLLKWKWPDLNTVDFLIEAPFAVGEKGLPLLCSGHVRNGHGGKGVRVEEVVFDHIRRVDAVSAGYLEEVRRRRVSVAVVECGYSRVDSEWHIKCVRWDKAKSNFLTTVVATVKAVMDDLQSADIVTACKKNRFTYRRSTT